MNTIEMSLPSAQILPTFNRQSNLTIPLVGDWAPHSLAPEQVARTFVRVGPSGTELVRAKWGRDQLETPHFQSFDPAKVKRGLLFASSYVSVDRAGETHPRFFRHYRVAPVKQEWLALGCSWSIDPGTGETQFAVLKTVFPGPDLRDAPVSEPLIVPQVRWPEWLNPNSESEFRYIAHSGTLIAEQI